MLKLDKKLIYKTCKPKRFHTNYCEAVGDRSNQFHIEHKWEGIVLSIDNEEIISELRHVESGDDYEFFFNKKQAEDDIDLIEEGALFYLFTGYTIKKEKKKKVDLIKFRRSVPDKVDIEAIFRRIEELDFGSIIRRH